MRGGFEFDFLIEGSDPMYWIAIDTTRYISDYLLVAERRKRLLFFWGGDGTSISLGKRSFHWMVTRFFAPRLLINMRAF